MLLLTIIFVTVVVVAEGTDQNITWDYDSKSTWPGICKEGRLQSPVNLDMQTLTYDAKLPGIHFDHYNETYNTTIISTKYTVELHFESVAKKVPAIHHGYIPGYYVLQNIHFHWTSEHTVNGKRHPFELHLVHYDITMGTFAEALKKPKGIAVLGVIFEESPVTNKNQKSKKTLMRVISDSKSLELNKETKMAIQLSPSMFLPENVDNFYRYIGSLTSPNCNEDVVWTVFIKTTNISKKQKQFFESIKMGPSENGTKINARDLQNLYGRLVMYRGTDYLSGSILKPSILLIVVINIFLKM